MIDAKELTPEFMQQRYLSDELGKLHITIPNFKKYVGGILSIDVKLHDVWRYAANLYSCEISNFKKVDEEKIRPENIEAVCIYGSVLYKHFPVETKKKSRKQWLFGPEVLKTVTKCRKRPGDLDLMVLTKEEVGDELFFPGKESLVETTAEKMSYGIIEVKKGLELHIIYRSAKQFLDCLGRNDVLSKAAVEYGLPIVGEARFEEITRSVTNTAREPLHEIIWEEDYESRLNGEIKEKEIVVQSYPSEKQKEPQAAPSQPNFINPWKVKIPKV